MTDNSRNVLADISNVKSTEAEEVLLQENDSRFVILPIENKDIWLLYKNAFGTFWTKDSVAFKYSSSAMLNEKNQKAYLKLTSFWSTYSEQLLLQDLTTEIQVTEARLFLGFQINMQMNHTEVFGCALNEDQFMATDDSVRSEQIKSWWRTEALGCRILVYMLLQSVFVTSLSVMQDLTYEEGLDSLTSIFSTILRDKDQNCIFGKLLFQFVTNKPSSDKVHSIIRKAVKLETQFLAEIFESCELEDSKLEQRVQIKAEELAESIGYPKKMTKCKRQYRKADKLSIRKKNQIKYEYLHSNDHIQASEECENTKIKTLSKQQYRRLKNENRKKSNSQTSSNGSMKSISSNNDTKFSIERPVLPESARCQALQKQSESDFSTPPLSAKSFHVNADWSEFEEREHFQFVSEHQIDISRVLGHFFDANVPKMKQPDSRFEIDHTVATSESEASELDGLLTPLEPMNEECEGPLTPTGDRDDRGHCGLWAMELSQARLERMQQDLQDVAMPVKQQATDILRLFDSSRPPFSVEEESKWSSVLTKLADMGITCSAMHCLLQDFIMQEDSELLQEQLVQWIQIGSSCSELLAVAKTAGDVSHSSVFFLESLSLLRQLWSSDHRQTIGEQQQHCEVLVTAMKRMVGSMRIEYTKLQSACSKIFPDLENESVPFLNDVEKAISRLEMNYTMSDEKKLVKLLNLNFKETSKEIKQFSGGKVPKPNGEIPHSVTCSSPSLFFRIPLKVMLLLLMSIVCLFGSSELETQQFASPEYNSTDVNSVEAMITQELLRLHNRFSTEK